MHPILCKIGPLNLYSYGFMVVLGFVISAILIQARAPKYGIKGNCAVDYLIVVLLTGIAGARVLYILLNLPYFAANPLEALDLTKGGLVWYGGFITAFFVSFWFARRNRIELWTLLDLVAPYVALGQAFGRIGCLLNGCCFGAITPQGFLFGDRYPTQVISAAALFVIFVILLLWQERRRFIGEVFLGYCIVYSCKRFLIEFLRGDNPRIYAGLTIAQVISIAIFGVAVYLFKRKLDLWTKTERSSG